MERIGVRELRQHASRYLDQVRAGNTVEVTDRGVLVALLVPPDPAQTNRDRLIADGRLRPGTGTLRPPYRRLVPTGSTSEVLDDLRDER